MPPTMRCVSTYSEGEERFEAGKSYDFHEEDAARLVRGAPSAWAYDATEVRVGGPSELVNYRELADETPPSPPSPARGEGAGSESDEDGDQGEEDDEGPDFDSMKMPALRAYAKEHGVEISGLTTKLDIVAAIERAEALGSSAKDEDGEEPAGDHGEASEESEGGDGPPSQPSPASGEGAGEAAEVDEVDEVDESE